MANMTKKCPMCNRVFIGQTNKTFCSKSCKARHDMLVRRERRQKKTGKIRTIFARKCEGCGKEFLPDKAHPAARFCSDRCRARKKYLDKKAAEEKSGTKEMAKIERNRYMSDLRKRKLESLTYECKNCGKEFKPTNAQSRYCCEKCRIEAKLKQNRKSSLKDKQSETGGVKLMKMDRKCPTCGKKFTVTYYSCSRPFKLFCCEACARKFAKSLSKLKTRFKNKLSRSEKALLKQRIAEMEEAKEKSRVGFNIREDSSLKRLAGKIVKKSSYKKLKCGEYQASKSKDVEFTMSEADKQNPDKRQKMRDILKERRKAKHDAKRKIRCAEFNVEQRNKWLKKGYKLVKTTCSECGSPLWIIKGYERENPVGRICQSYIKQAMKYGTPPKKEEILRITTVHRGMNVNPSVPKKSVEYIKRKDLNNYLNGYGIDNSEYESEVREYVDASADMLRIEPSTGYSVEAME